MAKFAANDNKSAFIKLSLFFATIDFYSHISFDIVDLSDNNIHDQFLNRRLWIFFEI